MRREAYKDEIPLFIDGLKKIGEGAGFTVDDVRARFGNKLFERVLWGTPDGPHAAAFTTDKSGRVVNKIKTWFKHVF
jgi:hypothetical protein